MKAIQPFKNTWSTIGLITLAAIVIVALLTFKSTIHSRQKNGFSRSYVHYKLSLQNSIKRNTEVTGICGITKEKLYFKTSSPARIFSTDQDLQNGKLIVLNVPQNKIIQSRFDCIVDYPNAIILAGNWPGIFYTNILTGNISGYKLSSGIFTRSAMLSPSSFVLRSFDTLQKSHDQIFIKVNPLTNAVSREKLVSEKTGDMGISTDGMLQYDSLNHFLIYIPFYSNNLLALDTNLHIVYKAHTIDTLNGVTTNAGDIPGKSSVNYTTITPSRFINMESCVTGGLLFNYSLLPADNEKAGSFKSNSVIDIYHIMDGRYAGSFYIPAFKHELVDQLRISGSKMVALYPSHICVYSLTL